MAEPGITITGVQAVSAAAAFTLLWPAVAKIVDWIALLRGQRTAQADGVNVQLNRLIDQLQEEAAKATAIVRAYEAELKQLRAARWEIDDLIAGLRDAALAARTMVHELQRRLGEPETLFPPLPRPGEGGPR